MSGRCECRHEDFEAHVEVNRIEDLEPMGFHLDLTVRCVRCGLPFCFNVPDGGLLWDRATISIDATTLSVPIYPAGGEPAKGTGFSRVGPLIPPQGVPDA